MTLLVTGWVAIDDIETPFARREGLLGGPAAYASLAASLFTDVRLLAAIGPDFPPALLAQLDHARIDCAGLTTVAGESSRWGARYHYDMNTRDTLFTHVGVNADWRPGLPPGWHDTTAAFLAATHPEAQAAVVRMLPALRVSMVDTITFYIETAFEELRQTMRLATFATVNDGEARQITGTPSIAQAGRRLLDDGARGVIIKLGEYGAVFMSEGDYFVAPGYPLQEIVDPTGAGDSFGGAFMGYLDSVAEITPAEVRRGIIYGSTAASFTVEGFGPSRLLSLTRAEVDARYREFRALTHFEVGE